jgi:hypothetical protein
MIKLFYALAIVVLATPGVVAIAATAKDTMVVAGDEVGRFVTLRNVSIKNGEVSGEMVNNSRDTLRDVVLEIRYSWRWANEFHPGKDDPGRTVYYTAAKEIRPEKARASSINPRRPFPSGATVLS